MKSRFTPQMYLDHYTKVKNITLDDIDVAPVVVLSWAEGVVKALSDRVGAEPVPYWPWHKRYPSIPAAYRESAFLSRRSVSAHRQRSQAWKK